MRRLRLAAMAAALLLPTAALAVQEPRPLFDAFTLKTVARRSGKGFVLNGLKSLVPRAADCELFIVAAELEGGGPALFIVEARSKGVEVQAEPAMGLRAAATSRLRLSNVTLPADSQPTIFQSSEPLRPCSSTPKDFEIDA